MSANKLLAPSKGASNKLLEIEKRSPLIRFYYLCIIG